MGKTTQPDIIIFFNSQENINTNMKIFLKMADFIKSIDFTDRTITTKKSTPANTAEPLKATHKKVKMINI